MIESNSVIINKLRKKFENANVGLVQNKLVQDMKNYADGNQVENFEAEDFFTEIIRYYVSIICDELKSNRLSRRQ